MTKQEIWVLFVFLTLLVSGLAAKAWLRLRPPAPLPPLPTQTAGDAR